ncbi:hypothetical protein [Algoriphagus aquimarinus]|uniref:hypothetical protein n=1 Tax=Algoriphagus aquimarinus TaxID=237018 RepID=UPI0030D75CA3|tara:strand:- start:168773 stop:169027 length:255 start_codon:yes stop_codon:yes gene_type:complete
MDDLTTPAYLLINEIDVQHHMKNSDPVFKVNFFDDKIDQKPKFTIYIKFFLHSTQGKIEYETAIRTIIKEYSINALAYKFECLN